MSASSQPLLSSTQPPTPPALGEQPRASPSSPSSPSSPGPFSEHLLATRCGEGWAPPRLSLAVWPFACYNLSLPRFPYLSKEDKKGPCLRGAHAQAGPWPIVSSTGTTERAGWGCSGCQSSLRPRVPAGASSWHRAEGRTETGHLAPQVRGAASWAAACPRLTRTAGSFRGRRRYRRRAAAPQSSRTRVKEMPRLVTVKSAAQRPGRGVVAGPRGT